MVVINRGGGGTLSCNTSLVKIKESKKKVRFRDSRRGIRGAGQKWGFLLGKTSLGEHLYSI